MNKEEAFEFISRMDWMHPKMKEACKVVEHELFRPKQEPPMINHKGLKEVMKFVVKKYVVFEGLVNPLVDQIMKTIQDHLGGLVYHLDFPNGEPNKEVYVSGYDDLGKPIIEQKPFQINCSTIEEEKKTCTFMFHENAMVIDINPHWSNGVVYIIGNNGRNYTIERLNTGKFYYEGKLLDDVSSMKLKDIIIDYWINKNF